MLLGLRTAIYPVSDIAAAKAWYAQLLEVPPYFDQPFYVGFAVGGFELGLIPEGTAGTSGAQPLWGVTSIETVHARLLDWGLPHSIRLPTWAKASRWRRCAIRLATALGSLRTRRSIAARSGRAQRLRWVERSRRGCARNPLGAGLNPGEALDAAVQRLKTESFQDRI